MQSASRGALAAALERLEATPDPGASGDVATGLFSVADLLRREPALRRALADPATAVPAKTALVDGLFASRVGPLPLDVLRSLVAERWSRSLDLLEAVETVGLTALLRVSQAAGSLDEVEDELFRFGRIVDREPALRAVLTDSGVPAERRRELLRTLLGGKVSATTSRLLERVLGDPLGRSFDRALEDLVTLAAARRQRLVATVRVAVALSQDQQRRLAAGLTRLYGREVQMQVAIEPGLVGGVVVEVGDEVLDASLARRITTVRRQLG